MSSFEIFSGKLADQGLELRKQWEVKREQHTVAHYLVYGKQKQHLELIVQHWPNDEYNCFFPSTSNKIDDDVAAIVGEAVET